MKWWNALQERERAHWRALAGSAAMADAWAAYKESQAEIAKGREAPTLRLNEDAWRAGFMAGNARGEAKNPYPHDSIEALSWWSGQIEGAAKPKGTLPKMRPTRVQPKP